MGATARRACQTYNPIPANPKKKRLTTSSGETTCASRAAQAETNAESPSPENRNPGKSNLVISSPKTSGMKSVASTKPRTAMGRFIQKIQRQVKKVVINPPTGGPMTGPINAGIVSQASAPTISERGTVRRITNRPTGTIIAPPIPCNARAATKNPVELAKPQQTDPSAKIMMASRKMRRAPNRSANHPDAGMKTAKVNKYEVSANFSLIGASCKSRAIAGNAVERTVASRFSMNKAQATINGTKTRSGKDLPDCDNSCMADQHIAARQRISNRLTSFSRRASRNQTRTSTLVAPVQGVTTES